MSEDKSQESLSQVAADIQDDLLYYKQTRTSFIQKMKSNKEFQNPKILEQTVNFFGIDGEGTQFDPAVYDPKRFAPEDYASSLYSV